MNRHSLPKIKLQRLLTFCGFAGIILLPGGIASAQSTGDVSRSNSFQTPLPFDPQTNTTNPSVLSIQTQNPFLGSVPSAPVTNTDIPLTINVAIQMALKSNLGLLDSEVQQSSAHAAHLRALSELLPQLQAEASTVLQTENLTSIGSRQLALPNRVGPFGWGYAQIGYSEQLLDFAAAHRLRAQHSEEAASKMTMADARNIVVLAAAGAYLAVTADQARVRALQASLESAETLNRLIQDKVAHELSTELDQIRTRVSERTATQRLRLAMTQTEKDKLALGRIIGFPADQRFHLTSKLVYSSKPATSEVPLVDEALEHRADLAASHLRLAAQEQRVSAAKAEAFPTLSLTGHYGGAGINFGSFNGNYDVAAKIAVPLFSGRRIESERIDASAGLIRARNESRDLEQRVRFDVKNSELDLADAEDSVQISAENRLLAQRAFSEEQDRFKAGVSQSQELIQARETVAESENNYVASVYADMLGRLTLIRAAGTAERDVNTYLGIQ